MAEVAGAGLAALPAGQVPEIGGTTVTALSLDVGQAWALPTSRVTAAFVLRGALTALCAQKITGAPCQPGAQVMARTGTKLGRALLMAQAVSSLSK